MQLLRPTGDGVLIASALAAATVPPTQAAGTCGIVESDSSSWSQVPEFDLRVWAATVTGVTMTAAHLYAAILHPWAQAAIAIDSVTNATETFNEGSHTLLTGDGPFRLSTAGVLPAGLSATVDYYAIKTGAGTFKLATSRANAFAGTAVAFSDDGSGQHTLSEAVASGVTRVHWHDCGLLGPLADGAITLAAQVGYSERVRHQPGAIGYAIAATIGAGTFSARIYPITES